MIETPTWSGGRIAFAGGRLESTERPSAAEAGLVCWLGRHGSNRALTKGRTRAKCGATFLEGKISTQRAQRSEHREHEDGREASWVVMGAEMVGTWLASCADTGEPSCFFPLIHRNKIIIHETRMKSREYFYPMVIRTVWDGKYRMNVHLGRRSRSVRICWL